MSQIYSPFKTALTVALLFAISSTYAQNQTTIGTGNCSVLVQTFTSDNGGHTSPSIYGGTLDSTFYYNPNLGIWTEMALNRTTGPIAPRITTIISSPYANPSPATTFDVGFWYQVPSAVLDRFQVRLVAIAAGPNGTTTASIVASSGVQTFANRTPAGFGRRIDVSNPANSGDTGRICLRLIDADIVNVNTTYRIEIAYLLNTAGIDNFFAAYDNLSIGPVTAASPLPVSFIGIVGNVINDAVNLRWDVADESNVKEYRVERSLDATTFRTVGTVQAQHRPIYELADHNVKSSVIYYRVTSVDIDGRTKQSGIVKVLNGTSYSGTLKAYPSPAQNQVTLQHSRLGTAARVTLTTIDGRILRTIKPANGASNTMIDISSLNSGLYLVKLDKGDGKLETTTIVKQ